MINKIKNKVKEIIKWDYLMDSKTYESKNFSKSLEDLTKKRPDLLLENRSVGKRLDEDKFSPAVQEIEKAFNFFSIDVKKYENKSIRNISEYDNFQSGTPICFKPFPPAVKAVKKALNKNNLYLYPTNIGNPRARKKFLEYLLKEGFKLDKESGYDGLSIENIAFTCSTSHAYAMIIKLIARSEDVILLTGPNYGLFAIESERFNARVELINLSEEDDWYVNPEKFAQKIDETNKNLQKKFGDTLGYIPKVAAFLNMNPHNPIGKVMSNKNKDLLEKLGDICLEKGVFFIDDLIYRDLTFDHENLARPLSINPKYFNNTISLFGISKSFGLASFRAGVVVAPIPIIRGISDQIYQNMVSIPVLQVQSIVGAFNGSDKRYKEYQKYFKKLIAEYQYRYNLYEVLVEGIDIIQDKLLKNKIIKDIKKYEKDELVVKILLEGIPGVKVRKKTKPDSGFFTILDFTELRGKSYKGDIIKDDYDLLKFLYMKGKVEFIMGKSMSWPNDEIIARVNFSIKKSALIKNLKVINLAVRELE